MAYEELAAQLGVPLWLLVVVLVWTIIWKGLALWKSARRGSNVWFIVLLIFQTYGVLPILYIFLFSRIKLSSRKASKKLAGVKSLDSKAKKKTKKKKRK